MSDQNWTRWLIILRQTWLEMRADQVSFIASGVAFRLAIALFPGVALLVWLGDRAFESGTVASWVRPMLDFLPASSREVVSVALDAATRVNPVDRGQDASWLGRFAPVLGVALALWSTNSGMRALFIALNIAFDRQEQRSFWRRQATTFLFTVGALLLIGLSTVTLAATPFVLSRLGVEALVATAVAWLRWPTLFVAFALGLALLYRYAPNHDRPRWPLVTVGSALAAALLVLLSVLFTWFTANVMSLGATYGTFSTVVAFLLWLWLDTVLVLSGAELDAVIAERTDLYGDDSPSCVKCHPSS